MTKFLHLVDDYDYIENNCYQHQLKRKINAKNIQTISLSDFARYEFEYDILISCLKQRTLLRELNLVSRIADNREIRIYDQDPWNAFMDNSPYKNAYEKFQKKLNVEKFYLTTNWWTEFLNQLGFSSQFVKMGILPEYCNFGISPKKRTIKIGFIGTIHPHRQKLFDELKKMGYEVSIGKNQYSYLKYLKTLQNIDVFIHSENSPIFVDKKELNMSMGLWIKDVEAVSQGCIAIRNKDMFNQEDKTYTNGLNSIFSYTNLHEIPEFLMSLPSEFVRQEDVKHLKKKDDWQSTVETLTYLI